MLQQFPAIGIAIVVTAIVIGVGYVVLTNFGNAVGGTANTTLVTISGYLGTSSGGLGSWILPVIALFVGLMFIGSIMGKKKY